MTVKKKTVQPRKKWSAQWIVLLLGMPALTVALAALAGRLMLQGTLPERAGAIVAAAIAGLLSFTGALLTALRQKEKKLLWGLLVPAAYGLLLLLGNLLFFGVSYGNVLPVLLTVFGAGSLGALAGAAKKKRRRYA